MRKYLFTVVAGYCLTLSALAQSTENVTVKLRNNGVIPREFKFVTRHPGESYPNVFTTFLLPGASHSVRLRVGTSITRVNQAEINETMNGRTVPGKPLLVVKATDDGQIINLK